MFKHHKVETFSISLLQLFEMRLWGPVQDLDVDNFLLSVVRVVLFRNIHDMNVRPYEQPSGRWQYMVSALCGP